MPSCDGSRFGGANACDAVDADACDVTSSAASETWGESNNNLAAGDANRTETFCMTDQRKTIAAGFHVEPPHVLGSPAEHKWVIGDVVIGHYIDNRGGPQQRASIRKM